MSRLLVGLTGGLASGKSTVARLLGELGCTVVDADEIIADLYRPGEAGAAAVEKLFGSEMLSAEGEVNRPALGAHVFGNPTALKALEAAVHPLVRDRTNEILAASQGIVVYEATLLVEAGRADDFDLVVNVEADPKARLARAIARGMTEESARGRLAAQGDGAQRRSRADLTLENDGSPEDLETAVEELHRQLQGRLQAAGP